MANKFCKDCSPDCLQEIPGGCIPYTGDAIPCADIKSSNEENSELQGNFIKLGLNYCAFLEENRVNLGCFFNSEIDESSFEQSYVAVKRLLEWACALSTDDIGTPANLYCLADGISVSSAALVNKSFNWSTSSLSDGVSYIYNLSEVIENLPPNFTLNGALIQANGNRAGSSKTLLASSKEPIGGFKLQPDNYPVNISTELRIGTPDGEVVLTKKVSLTGNYTSEPFRSVLDIKDISNNKNFSEVSQTQFNEFLSSAYCHLKQLYDNLRNIEISDCEYIQYGDSHVNSIIQTQSAKLCEALDRLKNIGAEKITYKDCDDDCNTSLVEKTIQEAFDLTGDDVCNLLSRMKNLEARVTELELQIDNCCT